MAGFNDGNEPKSPGQVFGEMVRRAYHGQTPAPPTPVSLKKQYCACCGQTTDHPFAYETGNVEMYYCGNPKCRLLHGFTVR